jgi:preprotein translocase subunit SecA
MSFLKTIFGDPNKKALKAFYPIVEKINSLEKEVSLLSDSELKDKTAQLKSRLENGETLDDILPEAFAAVREASKRTLGQRHFDVQLIGGMILHSHKIAEMRTGEGKTLVATLPAYLNALTGKGVHIVTVNDYLSRRDAVWMGQIYDALGLSVAVINHEASYMYDPAHKSAPASTTSEKTAVTTEAEKSKDPLDATRDETGSFRVVHEFLRPCSRPEAYRADITYGTNSEFGFDYLRDNLEYNAQSLRQRVPNYAIVDEIDSILIDEARTPLIISSATTDSENFYKVFAGIAAGLKVGDDFTIDEKHRSIALTDAGITKAEKKLGIENIYTEKGIKYVHHLETAVRAKALYRKDKEYVVKDDQIVIVDEFTGRLQPGRRWSEGLHQAIEAKEGVSVQKESRTFASITYQNFFRLYKKLAGMTGTAATSSEEFYKVYGLDVIVVPTNKPVARADHNDLIFQTEQGKFKAVTRRVKELQKKGQPVLVGTVSIEKNEVLSEYFTREGITHTVLNAKNHEREGEIIAQAGKRGAVTIATNMAGRGVDIKLGGNPAPAGEYEAIKAIGGLFVLGTERHEARRIDNQLRGRSGRQGDPGETQFFVSLEDTLMRVFAADSIKGLMGKLGAAEDEAIESRIITRTLETAQTKIEGYNFDARKHILEYDDVLNHQRKTVYERRRKILTGSLDDVEEKLNEVILGNPELEAIIPEKIKSIGREAFLPMVRQLMLQCIDMFWVEHLEIMDYTRSSVNLRAYGQRDPLVEYKKEGLRLFKEMQAAINDHIKNLLPHLGGPMASMAPVEQGALKEVHEQAQIIGSGDGDANTAHGGGRSAAITPAHTNPDGSPIGRNDPCFCGSGKKYKKCHGRNS